MPGSKAVVRVITAHRQREGAGFVVRRPVPTAGLEVADPFLLIDEMGPAEYGPGEAVGAPDHPHRGFETVTYMLDGEFEHEDSAGHSGKLGPGDVQWMTAGGGIIHSEEPSARIKRDGGRLHGFQIWVNLPAALKMTRPRYQEIPAERIPQARSEDGKVHVRVIAGEALGAKAVIDTHIPIALQDFTLRDGGEATVRFTQGENVLIYVFEGEALIGPDRTPLRDGQMAILGDGEDVILRAQTHARVLLLAGAPIGEPVARYGPFVMNTEQQIVDAINDFRSGKMGEIVRTAQIG